MEHRMKLFETPYEKIKSGKKKIEIRLFDEKRQSLKLGDTIIFSKLPSLNEKQSVKIIGLLRYRTFQELVDDFSLGYFGYPDGYDKQVFVESIYQIYSKEDEEKYGVLGIKLLKDQ